MSERYENFEGLLSSVRRFESALDEAIGMCDNLTHDMKQGLHRYNDGFCKEYCQVHDLCKSKADESNATARKMGILPTKCTECTLEKTGLACFDNKTGKTNCMYFTPSEKTCHLCGKDSDELHHMKRKDGTRTVACSNCVRMLHRDEWVEVVG